MSASRVLLLLSVIAFVLAMFGVALPVDLMALGLALFAGAHLV